MPPHIHHHPLPSMDHSYTYTTTQDDDAFYAELTRQILLLTDEDDEVQIKNKGSGRFNKRLVGSGVGGGGDGWSMTHGKYFSWSEGGQVSVPGWMERLWAANGGGTGVFIPRGGLHRSRRRYNKPKKSNDSSRSHPAVHKNLGSS